MRSRSGRGPGGQQWGLQELEPSCLGSLQAKNQEPGLRAKALPAPQPSHPLGSTDKTGFD